MLSAAYRPGCHALMGRKPWTVRAQGFYWWIKIMQKSSNTRDIFAKWRLQQGHPSATGLHSAPLKWLISVTSTRIITEGLTLRCSPRRSGTTRACGTSVGGRCAEWGGRGSRSGGYYSPGFRSTQIGSLSAYLYRQFLATVCGILFKAMRG